MSGSADMTVNAKALVVASLPTRGVAGKGGPLPSLKGLCKQYGVSNYSVTSAQWVLHYGTPALQKVVTDDQLPISTARWVSRLPASEQDSIAHRILAGASWRTVLPPKTARRLRKTLEPGGGPEAKPVRREAVAAIRDSLMALQYVLNRTEELDPEITPAEAAGWLRDLGQGRRHLAQLIEMLKERNS